MFFLFYHPRSVFVLQILLFVLSLLLQVLIFLPKPLIELLFAPFVLHVLQVVMPFELLSVLLPVLFEVVFLSPEFLQAFVLQALQLPGLLVFFHLSEQVLLQVQQFFLPLFQLFVFLLFQLQFPLL